MALERLQTPIRGGLSRLESWLEAERDHLPLWLPVMLGCGVAAWFVFPRVEHWQAVLLGGGVLMLLGVLLGRARRAGQALFWAGLMLALGCALVWLRADRVAHPVLDRPLVAQVAGQVERVELRPAEGKVRLVLSGATITPAKPVDQPLPVRIRVTAQQENIPPGLAKGSEVTLRARLAPPPVAALPGGYDFSRAAWFQQLGGTGVVLGTVTLLDAPRMPGLRENLSAHVRAQIEGSAGGIAAAFASGDRGGIALADEEAMRDSGLTHLLSISGLHITAVVAATMLIVLRVLALSPALALRWPLMVVAAGAGAAVGVGYTLLTGAEVPTIRSCIAALLVLAGLAMGREALTLRLVATGALIILLFWPEALVGASFQLSFAAITAIIAFHENRRVKAWLARREEGFAARWGRALAGLLATGVVVELALAPIALFHFHKSGLYGALANMAAIPWTTFVIMPLEALALLFDPVGLGAPFWWACGKSISLLIWLAHQVAAMPGAVANMASIPAPAFALMLGGGLWMLLWTQRPRWLGSLPFTAGALWALATPAPDILITNDGRHMALRTADGQMAMLRERAGDFIQSALAERAGEEDGLIGLDAVSTARCGPDMCLADVARGGIRWRVGATRSSQFLPWPELIALCPQLDLIVSDRRLPPGCVPRVLKLDRPALAQTGGIAITLGTPVRIERTRAEQDDHPWVSR